MVAIAEIKAANAKYSGSPTAVFVGATSGIGEATIKQLAKISLAPTFILIGRNEAKANSIIAELKSINGDGKYSFISSDVTLIKNVDKACEEVKKRVGNKLDYIMVSQGYLTFAGRTETSEGLDALLSVRYYSRLRFIENLLPLNPTRVLSCLAAGQEGKLVEDDYQLKTHYSIMNCASHSSTLTALSFEELAKSHPSTSFVHAFPGLIKTGIFTAGFSAPVAFLMKYVAAPLITPFTISPEEVGERMVYYLTNDKFEKGAWQMGADSSVVAYPKWWGQYHADGMAAKVMADTAGIYARILEGKQA